MGAGNWCFTKSSVLIFEFYSANRQPNNHSLRKSNRGQSPLDWTTTLIAYSSCLIGGLGWWFGFLGSPHEREYDCYLRESLDSQTTNPNQQLTISSKSKKNRPRRIWGCRIWIYPPAKMRIFRSSLLGWRPFNKQTFILKPRGCILDKGDRSNLVGGWTNPFICSSNWESSFAGIEVNIKIHWNHHPVLS